jgi:hypothetical protein
MSKQLPPKPHIDVLRKQARQLLRDYQAGDPAASNLVKSALPDLPPSAATAFSLRHAHQVTAHDYGFASWQALVDQVGLHGNTKPFAQLPGHYEELATSLADAVLAGESGCESLEEFAAAVTGAVKSHFQLKRAQALVVVSARHRELCDAEVRLDCLTEHRQVAVAFDPSQPRFDVE